LTLLAETRTPLVSYLASVLRAVRPLPPLDLELNQAYGNVLAEDVRSPGPLPAFATGRFA
jgi:molybdopterin molybdotransferase